MTSAAPYIAYDALQAAVQLPPARLPPIFSAGELGRMVFPPTKYLVPSILPEGCTILAGRPKLGKSWLALDLALAVARGDYCLGSYLCEQGDVLYLALEDNGPRLQSRIKKVWPPQCQDLWPDPLQFAVEWPRAENGGLDDLRAWIISKTNPRLIVIDVLAQFRTARGSGDNPYEADYRAVTELQQLASDFRLAVLVVHHVRKGDGDIDPFERVSGTLGLTGAADTTIVLDRSGKGCSLYARGRDIAEYEKAITFSQETCRWTVQGDAAEVHRSDERGAILSALAEATEVMTVQDIADATGMNNTNCRQLLSKMHKDGELIKMKRGSYVHPSRNDLIENGSAPPSHNGHKVTNSTIAAQQSG